MTPRQDNELMLMVGKMAGQMDSMKATLDNLVVKAEQTVAFRYEVTDRLDKMEEHNTSMNKVAEAFRALQAVIHDGGIKAKAYSKGFMIGVGVAAGTAGAAVTTAANAVYSAIYSAIWGA